MKNILKKYDIVVIAALLLMSLLMLAALYLRGIGGAQGRSAEIFLDGQLLQSIVLTDVEQELRVDSAAGYNIVQIGPQGVRMLEADCRNQDCVHAGAQTRPGGIIACLPHRLLILIVGEKEDDFDAISR